MRISKVLSVLAAALCLSLMFNQHAAAATYSGVGGGTSTVGGTTPDYATLALACAAITGVGTIPIPSTSTANSTSTIPIASDG